MSVSFKKIIVHFGILTLLLPIYSCAGKKIRLDSNAGPLQNVEDSCSSTREFVTTHEFLRIKKEFQLSDQEARSISERVAAGCSGAGGRFIKTTDLLTRSGLGSRDAALIGIQFALKSEEEAEAFESVFKRAFLAEYLDLDLFTSVKIAKQLSIELKNSTQNSRKDFEALTDFCTSGKSLDLPKPLCATFAQRIAVLGNRFNGNIAKPFTELFYFLKSSKGPGLITGEALDLSEQIISSGPMASENFITAYRYGVSKAGLRLSTKDSIALAHGLARKTQPVQSGSNAEKPLTKN